VTPVETLGTLRPTQHFASVPIKSKQHTSPGTRRVGNAYLGKDSEWFICMLRLGEERMIGSNAHTGNGGVMKICTKCKKERERAV